VNRRGTAERGRDAYLWGHWKAPDPWPPYGLSGEDAEGDQGGEESGSAHSSSARATGYGKPPKYSCFRVAGMVGARFALLNVTLGRAGPNEGTVAHLRACPAGSGWTEPQNTDSGKKSCHPGSSWFVSFAKPLRLIGPRQFHVYTALAVVPAPHPLWDTDDRGSRCRAMTLCPTSTVRHEGAITSSTFKLMAQSIISRGRAPEKGQGQPR